MRVSRSFAATMLLGFALHGGGSDAYAQDKSPWLDPPEDLGAAEGQVVRSPEDATSSVNRLPRPLPPERPQSARDTIAPTATETERAGAGSTRERTFPASDQAARTEDQGRPAATADTLEEDVRALASAYLDTWSAPNEVVLDTMGQFYAARVRFHGRVLSARALLDEKRRFVQRWPERNYKLRPGSMKIVCDPDPTTCKVRSLFDFEAANPGRRRNSQGVAALELTVDLKGQRPVIIAEDSEIVARTRGRPALAGDGFDD